MPAHRYVKEIIIRPNDIKMQFQICHKTIYNWIKLGVLPKQRKFGPQMVGWFLSDLDEFYQSMDIPSSNREDSS